MPVYTCTKSMLIIPLVRAWCTLRRLSWIGLHFGDFEKSPRALWVPCGVSVLARSNATPALSLSYAGLLLPIYKYRCLWPSLWFVSSLGAGIVPFTCEALGNAPFPCPVLTLGNVCKQLFKPKSSVNPVYSAVSAQLHFTVSVTREVVCPRPNHHA